MRKSRPPYPAEFRQRMVELVRSGRNPEELAEKFEPSAQAIRNWVRQADRDEGRRQDGLTTDERHELTRLRREVKTRLRGAARVRRSAHVVPVSGMGGAVGIDPLFAPVALSA